jgi:hypothetical protein
LCNSYHGLDAVERGNRRAFELGSCCWWWRWRPGGRESSSSSPPPAP